MFALRKACATRSFVNVLKTIRNKSTTTCFAKNLEHLKKSFSTPYSSTTTLEMQKEAEKFMLVFSDVVRDLTKFNDLTKHQYDLKDAENHFKRALDYNVPNGKKIRGLTAVLAYRDLMANKPLTPEQIRQAHMLGWCIEILHSVFLTADDVIDGGEIRRGKPCWYKVDDVKAIALNDILMVEIACFSLLKQHFGDLPCYKSMIELLHETELTTFIGQSLDYQMSISKEFSLKKHRLMCEHKTAHFATYAPIALSMMLAGYNDEKLFDVVKDISLGIGYFYQVQNDYLDYFGDTALEKPGTDIENGKASWLAASVMELGNDRQKEIMNNCYGEKGPECINEIKKIYNDFDFPVKFAQFKAESYENIKKQIEQTLHSDKLLQNVMMNTLNRAYDRI